MILDSYQSYYEDGDFDFDVPDFEGPVEEYELPTRPRLRRAAWFDPKFYADEESAVSELALHLAAQIEAALPFSRLAPASSRDKRARIVSSLIVNLLRVRVSDPGRFLIVPLKHDSHVEGDYRDVRRVLSGLEALECIRIYKGKQSALRGVLGLATRIEMLPKLAELFAAYKLGPSDVKCREAKDLIELRISNKEKRRLEAERRKAKGSYSIDVQLKWPSNLRSEKIRMERNLEKINKALRAQFIALRIADQEFSEIHRSIDEASFLDLFDRDLHRVFTIDPSKNGRFAGGFWATLPKEYRKNLVMAAPGNTPERCGEKDYSELHLRMLYAMEQAPLTASPYELYDDPSLNQAIRPIVKLLTLVLVNATTATEAKRAICSRIIERFDRKWYKEHPEDARPPMTVDEMASRLWPGCPAMDTLIRDIQAKHAPISVHFGTGAGRRLMNQDSHIAEQVMLRMIDEHNICPLPLHDGFVAPARYAGALEDIMADEFRKRFHTDIEIKSPAIEPIKVDGYYSQRDAEQLANLDYGSEQEACSVYFALLDDWAARQPLDSQRAIESSRYANSQSAVHWAAARITSLVKQGKLGISRGEASAHARC